MDLQRVGDWVDAGLLSPEQAAAIVGFEAGRTDQPDVQGGDGAPTAAAPEDTRDRRIPLFGEALGYLGAALVAIAGGIVLAQRWDQLRYSARLLLVALLLLVLLAAGAYLRNVTEPAARRLVSFTWALAVAALAWLAGLVGGRDGIGLEPERLALLVTAASAAGAVALWRVRSSWLQHAVAYVAGGAVLVSLLAQPRTTPALFYFGVALAAYAMVWLLLGEAGYLPPPTAARWVGLLGLLLGLRLMPSGALTGPGLIIAMAGAAALLGVGVLAERPLLLGFGAAAVFLFVPQAVFHFFGDTLGGPVALLLIGLVLIGTALLVVRARSELEQEVVP